MATKIRNILYNSITLMRNVNLNKTIYMPARIFNHVTEHQKVPVTLHYMKRDAEFKISRKQSIKKLEELLNCRTFIATEIVSKCKKFLKISSYDIGENYHLSISRGITKETIMNIPEVLAELDMPLKIIELERLPYNINITAPLLLLTYNKLNLFVNNEVDVKRIKSIAALLEIKECEVCKYLIRRPFLLSLNLKQLETNIKILTDFGITKEDIIKDLWVLRYSSNLIKERLLLAKKNNIETFKTWMIRAQPGIFEKYIKRRSETKSILGDNSLAEYLSERLECTEEVAKYLITKQPALQNKSLKKMNEMIDFLLKYGFQLIHIRRVPKILLHSVETTEKRLKELEAEGMQLDALYILIKSQKQYLQYYEAHIKTNKNKLKNS